MDNVIITTAEELAANEALRNSETTPMYARVKFGSDNSGIFGLVYIDVPINPAADAEFFGSAKWAGELPDGTKVERIGPAAAFCQKAKHAYEGKRGEAKTLSEVTEAHWNKDASGFPANVSAKLLKSVQALFDGYTGPSGKRSARTVTVESTALEDAFAHFKATGDKSQLKAIGINV